MAKTRTAALRSYAVGTITLAASLALSACSSSGTASAHASGGTAARPTDVSQICKAGAAEGEVIYWNQGTPSVDKHIWAAFNKDYPNIEIKETYVQPVDMVQKLTTLHQAGRSVNGDGLAVTTDFGSLLDQKGLIDQSFDWAKLSGDPQLVANHSLRLERQFIGLAYNTDHVKESDLPATWSELVNPKWKGQIVVDPRGDQLQLLSLAWGQDKVVSFVKNLMNTTSPAVIKGGTAGLLTVESGENLVETNGSAPNVALAQSQNAPVAMHYFDLIPAADFYYAIPKGAPHPYASACFAIWQNSSAGRAALAQYEYETNTDKPDNAPAGSKVITVKSTSDATLVANTAAAISKVITGK